MLHHADKTDSQPPPQPACISSALVCMKLGLRGRSGAVRLYLRDIRMAVTTRERQHGERAFAVPNPPSLRREANIDRASLHLIFPASWRDTSASQRGSGTDSIHAAENTARRRQVRGHEIASRDGALRRAIRLRRPGTNGEGSSSSQDLAVPM